MNSIRIAGLTTCHNRRAKTLAALEALFAQTLPPATHLTIYVVDDGSTDGTSEAIGERYPEVVLLHGDGNLFNNGGMRMAFAAALENDFDYYLWFNDDTTLYLDALLRLLTTAQTLSAKHGPRCLVVGSTADPETGTLTYGGVRRTSRWRPLRFELVPPAAQPQRCDTMNGNCVLVPRAVVELVGNLDPAFVHAIGDYDYGLRATLHGCSVWIAPGFVGSCARNSPSNTWVDQTLSLGERWRRVLGPKGLPPSQWRVFAQRHAGFAWPLYWLTPYLQLVLSALRPGPRMQRD